MDNQSSSTFLMTTDIPSSSPTADDMGPSGDPITYNDLLYQMVDIIIRAVALGALSLMGIVTNVINFAVFYRQGIPSDSSTTTLSALAVSDFLACATSLASSLIKTIGLITDALNIQGWDHLGYYFFKFGVYPKPLFTQITMILTAYLAFERAVSVVFPFKVKTWLSPARSCIFIVVVYVLLIITFIPHCLNFPTQITVKNETIWISKLNDYFPELLYMVHLYTNAVATRIICMILVIGCNFTIFWKVSLSQAFRKSMGSSQTKPTQSLQTIVTDDKSVLENDKTSEAKSTGQISTITEAKPVKAKVGQIIKSRKELLLLRMVMIISSLFVVCYFPDMVAVIISYTRFRINLDRATEHTLFAVSHLMEVINSSVNIFIYYSLSTRFRQELDSAMPCCKSSRVA